MTFVDKHWRKKQKLLSIVLMELNTKLKQYILKNSFFSKILRFNFNKVFEIVEDLNSWPIYSDNVKVTHLHFTREIENIMKELCPNFVGIPCEELFTAEYPDGIPSENKNLKEFSRITEEDSKIIYYFNEKINIKSLSDNFERIILYVRYLETVFEDYNIETILTFTEAFGSSFRLKFPKSVPKYIIPL